MSKKKQETYGSLMRKLVEVTQKAEQEKLRISKVMAAALLDDADAADALGDLTDTDLRCVMALLSGHIKECVAQMQAEKEAKKVAPEAVEKPTEQPVQPPVKPEVSVPAAPACGTAGNNLGHCSA